MQAAEAAIARLPGDTKLTAVERLVTEAIKRECRIYNNKRPEIVVIAHEMDPRAGMVVRAQAEVARFGKVLMSSGGGRGRSSSPPRQVALFSPPCVKQPLFIESASNACTCACVGPNACSLE